MLGAWQESVTRLINAPPRPGVLKQAQEWTAALGYQLGFFPLAPDPDIEARLAHEGLLLRPAERRPEDAEADREEFENGGDT